VATLTVSSPRGKPRAEKHCRKATLSHNMHNGTKFAAKALISKNQMVPSSTLLSFPLSCIQVSLNLPGSLVKSESAIRLTLDLRKNRLRKPV
jgi:hypothetical protein